MSLLRILPALLLALACAEPADPIDEILELHRAGRHAETVERLRVLVDQDPSRPQTNLLLGVALLRTGEAGLAVWPLRKAAESPEYAVNGNLLLARAMLDSRTAPDAIKAVDRVLEIEPEHVNALTLRVQAHLALSSFDDAMADIDRVLEIDPDSAGVLVPRVIALIGTERIDDAAEALEAAGERLEAAGEEVDPSLQARLCIARGLLAFENDDVEAAEAQYAACLQAFPTSQLVVTESVTFFRRSGQPERATELLRQTFEESGSSFYAAWFTLADFYVQRDEFDAALEAFEAALNASRTPTEMLLFAYTDTLAQAEQYEKARRMAAELDQPVLRNLVLGRILLGEGDARAALAAFEEGIRLWPNNAAGRFLAGQAAERIGDFETATSHYREAIRSNAGASEAGLALAELYAAEGDLEGALDAASRYTRSHADDPRGYLVSIRLAHQAGRNRVAAEGLQRLSQLPGQAPVAVAEEARLRGLGLGAGPAAASVEQSELDLTDPTNAPALSALLTHLAALGEHEKAKSLTQSALELHPEEPAFHELHGRALLAAGGPPEPTRAAFQRAVELEPRNARALAGLAELAAGAGDREAAVALYDRATEADPDDPAPSLAAVRLLLDAGDSAQAQARLELLLVSYPREAGAANSLARLVAERGETQRALELAERANRLGAPEAEETLAWIQELRAEPGTPGVAPSSDGSVDP
jgi:tetratricopeptide (TPR) repeat protein